MKKQVVSGGFTLIELLVVVLIIGILAAVAVPQYRIAVAKSRYAKLKHIVRALVQAEEAYYLANGQYTKNMADLDVDIPNGTLDPDWTSAGSNQYLYDWGFCQLITNGTNDNRAMCIDKDVNMGYREYFVHNVNTNNSGRHNSSLKCCDVRGTLDETDYRVSICKTESGNATREVYTEGLIQFWRY